ncbi:hypothetical protein BGK67_09590 [Streptomyces subrutilus]|uniref:Uncharacterized protein n=1 Tax=Streptomyces subrutilus TaxID=36818 RepID=A0A1E5PPR5_9ACTN|nr:hypothetical protein BGK67_09590 [Streptomyces subrutilus]
MARPTGLGEVAGSVDFAGLGALVSPTGFAGFVAPGGSGRGVGGAGRGFGVIVGAWVSGVGLYGDGVIWGPRIPG